MLWNMRRVLRRACPTATAATSIRTTGGSRTATRQHTPVGGPPKDRPPPLERRRNRHYVFSGLRPRLLDLRCALAFWQNETTQLAFWQNETKLSRASHSAALARAP